MKERIDVDRTHVSDEEVETVFLKYANLSGRFRRSGENFDGKLNVLKAWRSEGCELLEQKVLCWTRAGSQKKSSTRFEHIEGQGDGKKKVWTGKVLLLFQCLKMRANKGKGLARVQYVKCVPPLDQTEESLRGAFLQYTAVRSAETEHDAVEKKENRDALTVGDVFRVISFPSIVGTVHFV